MMDLFDDLPEPGKVFTLIVDYQYTCPLLVYISNRDVSCLFSSNAR